MKTNKKGYTKNSSGSLTINPNLDAYSYNWYKLGMKCGDFYLVNNFNYSPTTVQHYYKLAHWIEENHGLEIKMIEAPRGLQNLNDAAQYYQDMMKNKATEMSKPRKQEKTKQRLMSEIKDLENTYNFIIGLIQNEKQNDNT